LIRHKTIVIAITIVVIIIIIVIIITTIVVIVIIIEITTIVIATIVIAIIIFHFFEFNAIITNSFILGYIILITYIFRSNKQINAEYNYYIIRAKFTNEEKIFVPKSILLPLEIFPILTQAKIVPIKIRKFEISYTINETKLTELAHLHFPP